MTFVLLFSFIGLSTCLMRGNETDRLSLLSFKSLISDDPSGALHSWNNTLHFCQWQGITCSRRHQRVAVLDLPSLKLIGSIAPHIGNLSFLKELHLPGNKLSGEIPSEIGFLKRLRKLRLLNNSLNGEIPPNLSNCSALVIIDIRNNQLLGEIPNEFGSLTKLKQLSIYKNHLTGHIPASIGNLSSLIILSASYNSLYGSIPFSLGQLMNIQFLFVAVNNLSGTIPLSIFNLSALTYLEFTENFELQGSLPPDLFTTLPNLQCLTLEYNQFSGPIPVSITNASNLLFFDASFNQFSGSVPSLAKLHKLQRWDIAGNRLGTGGADDLYFLSSLVNVTGLEVVKASGNYFGGRLPETISNFSTNLRVFYAGSNQISGEIPPGVGYLVNLEEFSVQNNRISGTIPRSIGKLPNLVHVYLDRNQLTGQIPSSIGNCTKLVLLGLGANFLQGKVPQSLGMLQELAGLDLKINNLTGPVPLEIFGLTSLSISLDLSANNFVGSLPNEVGNLKNLGYLDFSNNQFLGNIPATLGTCVRLEQLLMGGNKLQGSIPESLGSLRGLEELDLSRNNLSVNGAFKNASAIFITGNEKLCGGTDELHLPKCSLEESKKRNPKTWKLVVSIVSAILGVSLLALLVFFCWSKKKARNPPSSSSGDASLLSVSYHNLLKATDGLSETRLIGVGAFGSVYKGILDEGEDQKIIAVKVLNLLKRGAIKSFLAECEVLKNIRHRNLVKVLTAVSGIDSSGNDFKALVYEFMVNGSLENWLHPTHLEENGAHETRRNLSLLRRLNIAIDTAWSLDYLHHQCECPIVHCDLKPSNILLDEEMVAHVSDFGLARFIPRPVDEPHTNQSSSIGVRGSTGYVAPEYGLGSEVSTWGDVYSYGIVLLEMFTGKSPTNEMFSENLNLHEYVEKALPGGVEDIVDPILLKEGQAVEQRVRNNTRVIECLVSLLRVGVACSDEQPKARIDICNVVAELNSIRKKLVGRRGRA
ncbi:hypothetical protein CRG98_032601 [Punica granatum]|nr:hypothetical protein CRG98_032601 [Punica granatum]